ncbi:hypothetical protein [Streptomyces xantholiticus]|uniref:hypothetical protein n=1 Tax=Streptomyces xantholiticus TaxID=68285 RepID=UPI0016777510|nr:hypothetical protein [Streptomyces xantholiticus]GGW41314.1 hypothetical protein GCM10010381_27710 [Streptomyces xantholiticus]
MHKRSLARHRLDGAGWAHPYGHGPFSPIVYADGGDGAGSGSGSDAAGDGTGGDNGKPPAAPAAGPWDGFQWDGKVDSLPADVAKVIREAREEAGKARTTAKENAAQAARQELLETLSKAVGLDTSAKPPTPEELTRQLTTATTERTVAQEDAAAARIELHVFRTATRLGADAEQLLDSRSFCDAIDAIDAKDPKKFTEEVETAINNAISANPQLRAGQVPRRGGGDFAGGPGTNGRPTSLQDAVSAALGG